MHRFLLSTVLSLSVLLSTLVAAQDASYTFTTIDVPGALYTEAHGINAAGQVVGGFLDAGFTFHGFLTDGATFITIAVPGASSTMAFGINAAGQIVGGFFVDGTHGYGFLTGGATFTTIAVPGATFTEAHGINTAG
jgi:probable HAF family extracellular repeat protein